MVWCGGGGINGGKREDCGSILRWAQTIGIMSSLFCESIGMDDVGRRWELAKDGCRARAITARRRHRTLLENAFLTASIGTLGIIFCFAILERLRRQDSQSTIDGQDDGGKCKERRTCLCNCVAR